MIEGEIIVALISATAVIVVSIINAYVLTSVGRMRLEVQRTSYIVSEVGVGLKEVKANTDELRVHTNSMKDEMMRLTRVEGVAEGRKQVRTETQIRENGIATGKEMALEALKKEEAKEGG